MWVPLNHARKIHPNTNKKAMRMCSCHFRPSKYSNRQKPGDLKGRKAHANRVKRDVDVL